MESAPTRAKNVGRHSFLVDQEPIPLEFCWLLTHHRRLVVENDTTVAHSDAVPPDEVEDCFGLVRVTGDCRCGACLVLVPMVVLIFPQAWHDLLGCFRC